MEIQSELKKSRRGGARPGAGRKRGEGSGRTIALRIPDDVAAVLDGQRNRSAFIVAAVRRYAAELGLLP